jgi:lysophospholipase L1-like esterase
MTPLNLAPVFRPNARRAHTGALAASSHGSRPRVARRRAHSARPLLGLLAAALLACSRPAPGAASTSSTASAAQAKSIWVPTWIATQMATTPDNLPPAPGLAGTTLRQVIQPSLGGDRARVAFSNTFGDAPLTLKAAHVAPSSGGAAIGEGGGALLFDGKRSVTVQPGAWVMSDPLPLHVEAFANLSVTAALDETLPGAITGHPGSRTTSFFQASAAVDAPDLGGAAAIDHWYFVSRVDVSTDARARAVVTLGDSITDGRGSTTNQNDRWPNLLARRLHASPATAHVAVLNQGAGGNRILRDGIGPNMLARFDRDVLAVPHVSWLIVLAGINDIGTAGSARAAGQPAASAEDLIAAYRQMIGRAHDHGILVYGATLLPFEGFQGTGYYSPAAEADRQAVNAWLRGSGELDAVIDFDRSTRDPAAPTRLSPQVDGGDQLHPSAAGYRIMADAIDLHLFE